MIYNHFIVILRLFLRSKRYTLINLTGLSISLLSCILVYLFVAHEFSYDSFHANSDRLFQVHQITTQADSDPIGNVMTSFTAGPTLISTFPEVESFCRYAYRNTIIKKGVESQLDLVHFVDTTFFELFDYPALTGDPSGTIRNRESIILTESSAENYFGSVECLHERMLLQIGEEIQEFTVGCILADPPDNSSLQFTILAPMQRLLEIIPEPWQSNWMWNYPETYLLLDENTTISEVENKLPILYERMGFDSQFGNTQLQLSFLPITDIHLHSPYAYSLINQSDPVYSYMLILVAGLIVFLAAVNYTTLSIGHSLNRAKEIGIRKVSGASPGKLMVHYLFESMLLSILALPLSLVLVELVLPFFNNAVNLELEFTLSLMNAVFLAVFVILTGCVSGFYPALFLARQKTASLFRHGIRITGGKHITRTLVFCQFIIALSLVMITLVVHRQTIFLLHASHGFTPDNVVSIFLPEIPDDQAEMFTDRLLTQLGDIPGVQAATAVSNSFGYPWTSFDFIDRNGANRRVFGNRIDENFLDAMDIPLVVGENFPINRQHTSSEPVLVNEALVRELGLENPLGIELPGAFGDHEIIGVVKDFHFHSKHSRIEPLVLYLEDAFLLEGIEDHANYQGRPTRLYLSLDADNTSETMNRILAVWREHAPDSPMLHNFLMENLEYLYSSEAAIDKVSQFTTFTAILIAMAGFIGLISLSLARRTREIGIRRVLGATFVQVVTLVLREQIILLLIASCVAFPITMLVHNLWTSGFAYHIGFEWWLLFLSITIAMLVMVFTGAYVVNRVTNLNPVETLRSE